MIIVTRSFTRTDLSAPWHLEQPFKDSIYPQEFLDYANTTYQSKKLHHLYTVSEDKLTLTLQSFWESQEAYQEYLNDPMCIETIEKRDAHNATYNITNEVVTIEEV